MFYLCMCFIYVTMIVEKGLVENVPFPILRKQRSMHTLCVYSYSFFLLCSEAELKICVLYSSFKFEFGLY